MIDSASTLRNLVAGFLGGGVPAEALDAELSRLSEVVPDLTDQTLVALIGDLELLTAEYAADHLDRDEFMEALRGLAPIAVNLGRPTSYTLRTEATGTSPVTTQRAQAVPDRSPASNTRRVAVLV